MMYEIQPYTGFGNIKFDMEREQVRALHNFPYSLFSRGDDSNKPFDLYDEFGIFFEYDDSNKLEAVEFGGPAQPTLFGKNILDLPFGAAKDILEPINGPMVEDPNGATAYKIGIALYIPEIEEGLDAIVKGVLIFRKGYYD
jgi:hypothetical protein